MSDLTDKAEYLLNHYQEGFPVFPPGSYKYGLMRDLIEALHRLTALEELTARQIKCTGEPTGTVDKNLKRIKELESLAFTAYCAGYESGNHDAVEGGYAPPSDYPEDWAERRIELFNNLLLLPEPPE